MLSTSRLMGQTLGAALVGLLLAMGAGLGEVPMLAACGFAVLAALCSLTRFARARRSATN